MKISIKISILLMVCRSSLGDILAQNTLEVCNNLPRHGDRLVKQQIAYEKIIDIICHDVMREWQTKLKKRLNYVPSRMAKIQNTDTTKCWWGWGAAGFLIYFLWECKIVQPL